MATLIVLRHGESEWNLRDIFAGWVDIDLTEIGVCEAARAGAALRAHGVRPDVAHTSVLRRAIRTADLALEEAGRSWIPVRRSWRLNERHYGALQGQDKTTVLARYGAEQFGLWRRSYGVAPPPLSDDDARAQAGDARYADLVGSLPRTESLGDVSARLLPYWYDAIVPDLRAGRVVLVVAHGNSLRVLIRYLEGLSDDAVAALEVPTGRPVRYRLDDVTLQLEGVGEYLG